MEGWLCRPRGSLCRREMLSRPEGRCGREAPCPPGSTQETEITAACFCKRGDVGGRLVDEVNCRGPGELERVAEAASGRQPPVRLGVLEK